MLTEEELALSLPMADKASKRMKEMLLVRAKRLTYRKGESFPGYERSGSGYYYIKRGYVNVYSEGENGGEFLLYRLNKDDGFFIMDSSKYVFGALTELICYDEDCLKVIATSAGGGMFLLGVALRQEENAIQSFNAIKFYGVERRLATVLLNESNKTRSQTVHFTHERLAGLVGTSREVITRKLAVLKEEGIVECNRGEITIKNKEKLKKKRT